MRQYMNITYTMSRIFFSFITNYCHLFWNYEDLFWNYDDFGLITPIMNYTFLRKNPLLINPRASICKYFKCYSFYFHL